MIERYSNKDIHALWGDMGRFSRWAWLELLWIKALAGSEKHALVHLDLITSIMWKVSTQDFVEAVLQNEKETRHDVRAFLVAFSELVPFDVRCWLHAGLTSSDLVDSGEAIARWKSFDVIHTKMRSLYEELEKFRKLSFGTLVMEYTHGQPAEESTADGVVLRWMGSVQLCLGDLFRIPLSLKWGGPISGTFQGAPGHIQERLRRAKEAFTRSLMDTFPAVNIEYSANCSQTVNRVDVVGEVFLLWRIGAELAKIAQDLRFWHLRGYLKSAEDCSSSVMAGKSNPAAPEKVQGLERVLQGFVVSQMSNTLIWENRDMTHSSVDRLTVPDAFEVVAHQAETLTKYLENSAINEEAMAKDLRRGSSRYARMLGLQLDEGKGYVEAWETVCRR